MSLDAEQALFDACLDAGTAERDRLLSTCGDAALADRVRGLLAAHDREIPSLDAGLGLLSPLAMPQRVGPYRVLRRLGEGAMGEVFLAEQHEPVRRQVALKVLKFGLATRDVMARFELERRALAMLAHSNIARILDAGATEDGRPFFAMEYVDGVPITRYCDEHGFGMGERLALFAQVCAGVQHAHLRGIIHRDLKPSNILVAEIDGHPSPQIIDFGIAKATTDDGTDTVAQTRIGHLLGTPEYMSPEQAQLAPLDVDLRTDVYSLGIVLFELLTGSRPYAVTRSSLSRESLAREIGEGTARRPSDCVTDARAGMLRGDLDWIILKAIEKDRTRRYSSVQEFAADLERHARNEAVLAGPPSWTYRAGRFVRRHRLAVAMAAGLFLAIMLFGSGMAWLARENARERDRANAEAEIARRVTEFTAGLFEYANPESSGSSEVSARELLDAGVERMQRELARERPETRAALLEAAADAYRGIGEFGRSSQLIGEAVEIRKNRAKEDPESYARALMRESRLRRDEGNYERGEEIVREAILALESAATAGVELDENALTDARIELAEILRRAGKLDEAAALATAALQDLEAQSGGSESHISALYMLGRVHTARGEHASAEPLLRRAFDMQVELTGEYSDDAVNARHGLADLLTVMGKTDEAITLQQKNVDAARRIYGESHAVLGIAWNNLANALSDIPAHYAEAEKAYLESIRILEQALGPVHPEIGNAYNNLGALYLSMERWREATGVYRVGLEQRIATLGTEHINTNSSRVGLGRALGMLGERAEAEALLRQALADLTRNPGPQHWRTANARLHLGVLLGKQGKYAEALAEVRAAHAVFLETFGPEHPRTAGAARELAQLEARQAAAVRTGR